MNFVQRIKHAQFHNMFYNMPQGFVSASVNKIKIKNKISETDILRKSVYFFHIKPKIHL